MSVLGCYPKKWGRLGCRGSRAGLGFGGWGRLVAVIIILTASDQGIRTLYPVGPNGVPDTGKPGMVASLGIAIYVTGAGRGAGCGLGV